MSNEKDFWITYEIIDEEEVMFLNISDQAMKRIGWDIGDEIEFEYDEENESVLLRRVGKP